MTEPDRSHSGRERTGSTKSLLVLAVVCGITIVALTAGPASAHESATVGEYELTFGGSDEPVITGERMWLELQIVDANDEPVPDQADTLVMEVEHPDGVTRPVDLAGRYGEPAYYEAPIIFTEPGTYTIHVEGTIEDTEVHEHFEKEVHDHTALQFPADDPDENQAQVDPQESSILSIPGISFAAVLVSIGAIAGLAFLIRRRD